VSVPRLPQPSFRRPELTPKEILNEQKTPDEKMAKLIPVQTLTFVAGLAYDFLRNRDAHRKQRR
jgi:hypothetical protein